jgi:hypothetical protein
MNKINNNNKILLDNFNGWLSWPIQETVDSPNISLKNGATPRLLKK